MLSEDVEILFLTFFQTNVNVNIFFLTRNVIRLFKNWCMEAASRRCSSKSSVIKQEVRTDLGVCVITFIWSLVKILSQLVLTGL